jgi:hypothetical protein
MNEHKIITPVATGYDDDLYVWSRDQAARLRAFRPANVDWENIAEEIESLGKNDRRSLQSDLKVVLVHLIKWRYQPEKRKSGWRSSINEHRDRIDRIIRDSPSLARVPAEGLTAEYRKARVEALQDTRLPKHRIPETCPFAIEQVLDPDYWPKAERSG